MKRILLLVKDEILKQKIHLALFGEAEIYAEEGSDCDGVIREGEGCIFVGDRRLSLPLSHRELREALSESAEERLLSLDAEGRSVRFGGEIIKLTEVEFRLLSELYLAGGEYVGREALLLKVWGGEVGGSILNVYIHYLR